MRIAAFISHPVQYYSPIFRELSKRVDLHVFFGQNVTPLQQAATGFGVGFDWDVDLFSGYESSFLHNLSRKPSQEHFFGCDTPEIHNLLRLGQFDALMVMGWYQKAHLQAIWAAKRLRIPVMVRGDSHLSMSRSIAKRFAKALIFKRMLRVFDAAIYVGTRSREFYEYYEYPASKMFYSPHCIDNEWFGTQATGEARNKLRTELGIGQSTSVVLMAAKMLDWKRHLDVIDAIQILRSRGCDAVLLTAGSGVLEGEVAERARMNNVPLFSLGFCNQSKMPSVYAACEVLVVASTGRETWGLVANEALACGKPVIISDACGCAPDLAADGVAGRTYPMGDIRALADRIGDVLASTPGHEQIKRISDQHSVAVAVDGIERAAFSASRNNVFVA
jgi:glycosyltransferase involved in cell wall biosynthesis